MAQKTGDQYYKDLEQSRKVAINSMFGLCNAPGLLFNSPEIAAKITEETRKVIDEALVWASGKDHTHWTNLND